MAESKQGWDAGEWGKQANMSWLAPAFPPLWGVYHPPCMERGSPHAVIVVVECYYFLIIIIDVDDARVAAVSYGLFCTLYKIGHSVRDVGRGATPGPKYGGSRRAQQRALVPWTCSDFRADLLRS